MLLWHFHKQHTELHHHPHIHTLQTCIFLGHMFVLCKTYKIYMALPIICMYTADTNATTKEHSLHYRLVLSYMELRISLLSNFYV
jgi:hypothetical protein